MFLMQMNEHQQQIVEASRSDARYPRWWPLWRIARLLIFTYLIFLPLAMFFEERLIFQPFNFPEDDWQPHGLHLEDARITAADGTKLHGWYVPHEQPLAHILFLHGNAGNITHRADILRELHNIGAAVLVLDYRGYGKSEGKPTEQGVLHDARAARTCLAERANFKEEAIVLMGRSLGGGVAVDLTTDVKPRALILESTFTSMPDVAAVHYPFLPVHWAMKTQLDSMSKIKGYHGPLLQSHGAADEIIPFALGEKLHDACPSEDKVFLPIPGGRHNDFQPREYFETLRTFLEELP